MIKSIYRRHLATALIATVAVTVVTPRADARGWSFTGRFGRTFGRTVTPYNYGGGNFGRSITATRPDGRTATSTFNRSVSNGTISDSRTITGFNGATSTGTFTRTPGQGWTATRTGPGDQARSASASHYNNGDGNAGRTATFSGPAGTTTRESTQTNNGNGTYTDSRTITGPNGQSVTNSFTRY